MKSIRRGQHMITLVIFLFIIAMITLVVKIHKESAFYMTHANQQVLGKVYDRSGDVLFDGSGEDYEVNYFLDVGNLIGDDKGQMSNTLVARNLDKLNNYSFATGLLEDGGKAAIYTSLDHYANQAVYNAYNGRKGCAVAYDYKTGEILVCVSLPSLDVTEGYSNIANFESGTLISKNLYGTVPGSTQKVSTLIAALEVMGADTLFSKSYTCTGEYMNKGGNVIKCHNSSGHGTQNIQEAIENSCNPFFAQLVEDEDFPLESIREIYRNMGYAVDDDEPDTISIDGIICQKASTTLVDPYDFNTQWGCIGQGDTLVSPVQLMMWQSAIANGTGKMTMPYLIDHVTDVNGRASDYAKTEYSEEIFSPATAETVRQILLTNGSNNYTYSIDGYSVGVKSGTAQVKNGDEENSLLAGFVDDSRHPIAFCIMIEDKNGGSIKTEHIAQVMLDALCS
ncbi:MAG: ABC transporter permease [Ruminococcus sp.]|nr:ABC transporter permease [Ruminococcus sp.]